MRWVEAVLIPLYRCTLLLSSTKHSPYCCGFSISQPLPLRVVWGDLYGTACLRLNWQAHGVCAVRGWLSELCSNLRLATEVKVQFETLCLVWWAQYSPSSGCAPWTPITHLLSLSERLDFLQQDKQYLSRFQRVFYSFDLFQGDVSKLTATAVYPVFL